MKPIVVKLGGSTLGSGDTALEDLAALQKRGLPLVVVHGGGRKVSEWLERLGIATSYERGLRVTDERAMEVIIAVLGGVVNKELVAGILARGGRAIGLSGLDGGMLLARVKDPALGRVGEIVRVDTAPLWKVLEDGYIPVLAPFGVEEAGGALNINGDTAAAAIARSLGAQKFIFLTDVPGVLDADGNTVPCITPEMAEDLAPWGAVTESVLAQLRRGPPPRLSSLLAGLSAREFEVLNHIAQGHSNIEIAETLGLSAQHVKVLITSILHKLNVSDRAAAVVVGIRGGMLLKVEACFLSTCSCLIIDGREPHALLEAIEGRATGTRIEGGHELA